MTDTPPAPTHPFTPRAATSTTFLVNGLVLATWVLHIPDVRDRLHLSDAQVGTAILFIAVGSMFSMPLSGPWIARHGSAAVTRLFGLLFCLSLPLPFLAPSLPLLCLALAAVGLTNGAMDVAMNAQGVAVERQMDRPVLSSFHAWFSFGNLGGALLGSVLLAAHVGTWTHVLAVLAVSLALLLASGPHLLPRSWDRHDPAPTGGPSTLRQRLHLSPAVLTLGLLCFLGMLGEGATGDWGGLYFRDVLQVGGGLAGAGYTAFTLAMTLARIFGDRWRSRHGETTLMLGGSLVSGAGVLLAILAPSLPGASGGAGPWVAVTGYALTGFGVANLVPVLYGSAGRALNAQGLAQVATLGYLGFLAGPPLIGYVAHFLGLRAGLGVIALSLLLVAALAPTVFTRLRAPRAEARPDPAAP
ncbi:MFS transporter [Deinococcus aquiradiocola]|uniref:MFS transporter n=1 Tax=Deinococcus aquiradiocola TaxID=393059 RepID=A0A917PM02_9DEIO|nr:MFS transporter [Deinococcus aquiradiocola]GGJ83934.1 MFS transporter [Deinococcus aquiradiocola]